MIKPERMAGILLHITSLPGKGENGDFGEDAFQFVDFLEKSGIKLWQVLPLGPTMADLSPYQSTSAHAGNPALISIDLLSSYAWFDKTECSIEVDKTQDAKSYWLKLAFEQFQKVADENFRADFRAFCEKQEYWLKDYALFVALKEQFENKSWVDWPVNYRNRDQVSLEQARKQYAQEIEFAKFVQFIFFSQWEKLRKYANSKNIRIFGDLPLFVSHDSADVWANKELFKLDGEGNLLYVAGVPPDYFSETGQRWGNPVYDWVSHEVEGFNWWIDRLKTQFELYDYVRIDHFRGLEGYWEIPADHETALNGKWVKSPGGKMLHAVAQRFGKSLPLIAEDLGSITDEVLALKNEFKLPGMKILQFAFGGSADNPYLPHHHEEASVVYTGTHDNNTTLGWFNALPEDVRAHVYRYYGLTHESMPWLLNRSAFASVACMAVLPMQDVMALDETARMNVPGTVEGNWSWRFQWDEIDKVKASEYLLSMCHLYDR